MSDEAPTSVRAAWSGPPTVLVVDDDAATRSLTGRWLARAHLDCVEAASGEMALEIARRGAPQIDAIVLDVMMPGIDGFETLRRLQRDPYTAAIPVLLLTAHATDDADVVRGVELGAVDHITKPYSGPVLVAKVRAMCERSRATRELAHKLQRAEAHATIDALTRLGNRRAFEQRLRAEGANAARHRTAVTLVLLDLDHFKSVNDTFGHAEGDRVLVHVADAMRAAVRAEDGAFRYGGEEFAVLLRACDREGGRAVARRVRDLLRERPMLLGPSREPRIITFSAGVASAGAEAGFDAAHLTTRADVALYRAKHGGRDRTELSD